MELKDLIKEELNFSKRAFPELWKFSNEKEFLLRLEFFSNALAGEVGEFANIVKKLVRKVVYKNENIEIEKYLEDLKEETVDIFIYTILISHLLNMDLEKEVLQKIEKNKKRFLK